MDFPEYFLMEIENNKLSTFLHLQKFWRIQNANVNTCYASKKVLCFPKLHLNIIALQIILQIVLTIIDYHAPFDQGFTKHC